MNQILETNNKKYKFRKIFKLQFLISFIAMIVLFVYVLSENKVKNRENEITNIVSKNAEITALFKNYNINENIYFCTLKIEKINLEYFVYENYSEENLKILPCKFSGGALNENSNICIIGHNYFDDRFFGNLDELEIGDKIGLESSLDGKNYNYYITDIYEIDENNIFEAIKNENDIKTVTLCTCTTSKNMRLIIKAREESNL